MQRNRIRSINFNSIDQIIGLTKTINYFRGSKTLVTEYWVSNSELLEGSWWKFTVNIDKLFLKRVYARKIELFMKRGE